VGKQVNFYMLGEDERAFEAFLLQEPDVLILSPANTEASPLVFDSLPAERNLLTGSWQVYLSKRGYPIHLWEGTAKAGPKLYHVDMSGSSVIQFGRSFLRSDAANTLTWGWLWADTRRLTPDNLAFEYKGEGFEKWYDSLARWIRRRYRRVGDRYVGPRAYEWHLAGGILQP